MSLLFIALLLAQGTDATLPSAGQVVDQRITHVGGGTFLLGDHVGEFFYKDPASRAALMRVGLERGCVLFHDARNKAVAKHRAEFDPLLIAAMRKVVPVQRLATFRTSHDLVSGALTQYRGRVTAEVKQMRPALFVALLNDFRTLWEGASAALAPAAPGSEAGRFADWHLERPIALSTACMLIASGQNADTATFTDRKAIFDGFYRRGVR